MSHRDNFEKHVKTFKAGVTGVKNAMQNMLVEACEHRVETMQNGKGGDASLLSRAYYLAREAKVVRANDIIPYIEELCGAKFDDTRKTDEMKLGQFVPVNGKDVSTVKMNATPWYEYMKAERAPQALDLDKRIATLATMLLSHLNTPVKGDKIDEDKAVAILSMAGAVQTADGWELPKAH